MDVVGVDERDSLWEDHGPRFRVYLFEGEKPGPPWTIDTYDIAGADVLEVIDWAYERADGHLFSVALVWDNPNAPPSNPPRGLVWLVGHDANNRPLSQTEQHMADRMRDLRRQ